MNETRFGRGMMVAASLLGMGMLTWYFGGVERRSYNPNEQPESISHAQRTEVVLDKNRQGHYVASGTINGEGVVFLLDTGATDVAIPGRVAADLGLAGGARSYARTANGTATVYNAHIDELTLGAIVLRDIDASIVPTMEGQAILLGMSALGRVEFTQQRGRLTLRQYR